MLILSTNSPDVQQDLANAIPQKVLYFHRDKILFVQMSGLIARFIDRQRPSGANMLSRGVIKSTSEPLDLSQEYYDTDKPTYEVAYSFVNALAAKEVDLDKALDTMHTIGRSKGPEFYRVLHSETEELYQKNYADITPARLRLAVLLNRSREKTERKEQTSYGNHLLRVIENITELKLKTKNNFLAAENVVLIFSVASSSFDQYITDEVRQKMVEKYTTLSERLLKRARHEKEGYGQEIQDTHVNAMREKLEPGRKAVSGEK